MGRSIAAVLFTATTGIAGAALIHIIVILALPAWTGKDAWTRVEGLGAQNVFYAIANEPNATGLYNDDPWLRAAVCRFSLDAGPIRVSAPSGVELWSVAAFDPQANEIFSMNDRSAIGPEPDITFATPAQLLQLRRSTPAQLEGSVLVETRAGEGYVTLRAAVPSPSMEPSVRAFLAAAECGPADG